MSGYDLDQREFYADCKEDGGLINIYMSPLAVDDDPNSLEVDPKIWRGDAQVEPVEVETWAIFIPPKSEEYDMMAYVPGFNLERVLSADMEIEDASGALWNIKRVMEILKPDGNVVIYYLVGLTNYPNKE